MRTGTEFISEISAATIFTSFNFHISRFSSFRFSGKGEVNVYRMCMCMCMYMCFIVSILCHVDFLKSPSSCLFRVSSYEPGQPSWLGFRDLASPLFSL